MQDYWHKFDLLCLELTDEGEDELVNELKHAQGYVNGLTDGWYEFLFEFERIIKSKELKSTTKELASGLIEILKFRLENR